MPDYSFEVVNVVGTGDLPVELDLASFAEDLRGETWENESPQPGLHLHFEEDGPMTTFYMSGSYIIRASNAAELDQANDEVLDEIERLGIIDDSEKDDIPFSVSNVVSLATVDAEINLAALAIELGLEHTEYEPEQFPALVYRRSKYPCTFLVFANGKIVIPGADSVESSREAFNRFSDELDEFAEGIGGWS